MACPCALRCILGICSLFLGCAYPHLEMGQGVAGGVNTPIGGASARSSSTVHVTGSAGSESTSSGGVTVYETTRSSALPMLGGAGGSLAAEGGVAAISGGAGSGGAGGVVSTSTGGAVSTSSVNAPQGGTSNAPLTTTTVPSGNCAESTNLFDSLDPEIENGQWIGGIASDSSDDPCGVQGTVYAFSDPGVDAIDCTDDDAIRSPACYTNPDVVYSPCAEGRCCIRGATSAAPAEAPDAPVWGAGIGLFLSMDESGDSNPYAGRARGFVAQISGNLNGQTLRFEYGAADGSEPIPVTVTEFGEVRLPFPSLPPTTMQFYIEGGIDGEFELCIDRIAPML